MKAKGKGCKDDCCTEMTNRWTKNSHGVYKSDRRAQDFNMYQTLGLNLDPNQDMPLDVVETPMRLGDYPTTPETAPMVSTAEKMDAEMQALLDKQAAARLRAQEETEASSEEEEKP